MDNERTTRTDEIVKEISLKIGYFGIGNAGSQIGLEIYKHGIPVKIANTSVKDLHGKLIPEDIEAFLIEDNMAQSRGAGRNRRTAKLIYKEWNNSALMFNNSQFVNWLASLDIIMVGSSTAGGTGSGLSIPIAYQIASMFPSKVVILVGVLPRLSESVTCQKNTIDYFKELESANSKNVNIPYMVYDLEKYASKNADDAYDQIARDIADAAGVIAGSMSKLTENGMIDERDLLTAITVPGYMAIYTGKKVDLNKVEGEGIQGLITSKIKTSSVCQHQRDKISGYFAMFLDIQEESDDPVKKNDFTTLTDYFGRPLDIFVNMSVNNGSFSDYGLIVSGMSIPADRLNQCDMIVSEYEDTRRAKSYDMAEVAAKHTALSENSQIDKLLGSSSREAVDISNIDMPDDLL